MLRSRTSSRLIAALVGVVLIAGACGSSKSTTGATTTAAGGTTVAPGTTAAAPVTTAPTATTAAQAGSTTAATAPAKVAMTETFKIKAEAKWSDGTPMTVKDIQCTQDAIMNTPGSNSTSGNDQVIAVKQGATDKDVIVEYKTVYAPWKNVFNVIIPAHKVKNCKDVSADFKDSYGVSGREWMLDSWSATQSVLLPNPSYWNKAKAPKAAKIVMVPEADTDTEINSLKSGQTGFIFPQAFQGIKEALADPNIKYTPGYGTNYEGLYFQQKTGPFADKAFRTGFMRSLDRSLILKNIYDPIFPGSKLLDCGLWVPTIGKWCKDDIFKDAFNAAEAEKALTAGGYKKDATGMWAKDGKVPEIRWIINTGNKRRESTQALMLPELKKMGFNVKADNCDSACYFQKRLPALDFDMAMYINTAQPDPTITSIMSCDQVPSDANGNKGQNSSGYCNKDASKLMADSDAELDVAKRTEQIHKLGQYLFDDAVMLPLFQFPNIAAWRTDKIGGPVDGDASNYRSFSNSMSQWESKGGDIVVGAEQWPDCINPITECANSSWMVWTTAFPILPALYDTTNGGDYVLTDVLDGEAVVKVA